MNNPLCADRTSINTGIGCISANSIQALLSDLLPWFFGIAGGVALLLIVYAGIQISTSAGDPQKIAAGKELLVAAIGGLILLVMSVFALRFLGVNILDIPGLGQ